MHGQKRHLRHWQCPDGNVYYLSKEWLSGVERGTDILDNADVPVHCEQDVEQLSLWD